MEIVQCQLLDPPRPEIGKATLCSSERGQTGISGRLSMTQAPGNGAPPALSEPPVLRVQRAPPAPRVLPEPPVRPVPPESPAPPGLPVRHRSHRPRRACRSRRRHRPRRASWSSRSHRSRRSRRSRRSCGSDRPCRSCRGHRSHRSARTGRSHRPHRTSGNDSLVRNKHQPRGRGDRRGMHHRAGHSKCRERDQRRTCGRPNPADQPKPDVVRPAGDPIRRGRRGYLRAPESTWFCA